MKKNSIFTIIIKALIIFVVIGIISAGIDFFKMKSGNIPIFNIKKYDNINKKQTFRGIFYKASRKISTSENESLVDSSEIEFAFLIFKLNVPKQFKENLLDYNIETHEAKNCDGKAKLYYADKDIKVYIYCLDEISLKKGGKSTKLIDNLKKNNDIINDIDSKLTYLGLYKDQLTLMLTDDIGLSNNGLTMYHCNESYVKDYYIGPKNMKMQEDFCTYKDDDFKFMYEIKEEPQSPEETSPNPTEESKKDVVYEDEKYRYEFSEPKSNRVFIVTPAVRGTSEKKIPIKQALNNNLLTIDEVIAKGLKLTKIDKEKERLELIKKQEEEKKKAEELAKKQESQKNS